MYGRNVTLRVSRAHARTLIPDVLALLAEDRIHPERITTLQAPIDDAAEVLTCHLAGQSIKTVLTA
jgi:threonine dehydrogenase-like Zn-dependent dehydrogenase